MRTNNVYPVALTTEEEYLLIQAALQICIFPVRKIKINDLVKETNIQEARLRPAFKALFGTGIYKFHFAARMKEARRLIEEANLNLKQIAHFSGYSHSTNFCNGFRAYYGYSPGQLQKNCKMNLPVSKSNGKLVELPQNLTVSSSLTC